MGRYREDTWAGKGYDAQRDETARRIQAGETFTVKELAELLDISPSRCNDIANELIHNGVAVGEGRPRVLRARL